MNYRNKVSHPKFLALMSKGRRLQNSGFTLVELIVVITILAILGTIAFISLQGYSKSSRDSVRISDLSTIKTSLELFHIDAGKYPLTTGGFTVTYSGSDVWTQGTFGESTTKNIDRLDDVPTDPLTEKEYTYSTTNTRQEFQLGGLVEGDILGLNTELLEQANAGDITATALVTGNYNGVLFKTLSGSNCEVLAIPSIISSLPEAITTDLNEIVASGGLVYNGYNNLPSDYEGSKYNTNGGFDFAPASIVAYTDTDSCKSLFSSTDNTARKDLITGLQTVYLGSIIENEGEIATILAIDPTNDSQIDSIGVAIVNNSLGGSVEAAVSTTTSGTNRLVYNAVAYTGNGTSQDIVTGIESYDINYDATKTYNIGDLAFDRKSFKLYKSLIDNNINNLDTWGRDSIYVDGTKTNDIHETKTTYIKDTGTVSQSSEYSISYKGATAWSGGSWYSYYPFASGGYTRYILSEPRVAKHYQVDCSTNTGLISYRFEGYNGSSWVVLDTVINAPSIDGWRDSVQLSNNIAYEAYQIVALAKVSSIYTYSTVSVRVSYEDKTINWEEITDDTVVPFKSSKVWVKARNGTTVNLMWDTLRGIKKTIASDQSLAEYTEDGLTSFGIDGFTVGTSWGNNGSENYIAWQQAYHKIMITTTNHGKRALVAFDDVSNRSMILYQGSGIAGHEVPHGLATDIGFVTTKNLDAVTNWGAYYNVPGKSLTFNESYLEYNDSNVFTTSDTSVFTVGTHNMVNGNNSLYMAYSEANSSNIKIGNYIGTGTAGNAVNTGLRPAYVMTKKINNTADWYIIDNKRDLEYLRANLPDIESSVAPYINIISNGFDQVGNHPGFNTFNDEYLYITYGDSKGDGGGSYADIPGGY